MSEREYAYDNQNPRATVLRRLDPLVIEKPRSPIHIHTYGGETPFFKGLTAGRLLGTVCAHADCRPSGEAGEAYLPPRVYCPDCLEPMVWEDLTERASQTARVHTHITVARPGAFNRVPMPCHLISVEIDGVCTVMMSQLRGAEPVIGLPIRPVFETEHPTFTVLDLAWVPRR